MKLNKAQQDLLKHIDTGAYIKTRPNPNTYEVHKAGYYHWIVWIVRSGTVKPFIQDGTLTFNDKLGAYVKASK